MCGICGKIYFNRDAKVEGHLLKKMMDIISYRGPDDDGVYLSGPVGLGHRRLSIIDLSSGRQPISNEDDTVWIVFNGEIYNYRELKSLLEQKGHVFKTKTDTEVIIHCYEEYGEDFPAHLRGMFAIALWDERKKTLSLVRDRVGIKPVYYYAGKDFLVFASEIKAILEEPGVPREMDYRVIGRALTYFYTPGPDTLIKGIQKLEPGYSLSLKDGRIAVKKYWDLDFSAPNRERTLGESKEQLMDLLRESARLHMISDVPVGILLSGGVDSTALLNLCSEARRELSTFTIGFDGEGFADERPYAKLAADRFGTDHHEMTMTARDFVEFLPRYVWHMEEVVCEPPAIALYYITKLAKEYVKVLISGEGGDEAFAGYQNYRNLVWMERFKRIFRPLNGSVGSVLDLVGSLPPPFERFKKYAPLMSLPLEEYYFSRTSSPFSYFNEEAGHLYSPEFRKTMDEAFNRQPTDEYFRNMAWDDPLSRMLYVDTKTWLPDDLLIKADKITMANSIELRVPLLDHRILEFAASLPSEYKLRGFTTKYILKEILMNKVPLETIKRKKTGFPVPYGKWLKNDLSDYVSGVLLDPKTLDRGYFNKKAIQGMLADTESRGAHSKEIFSLLTLELWHRMFFDERN